MTNKVFSHYRNFVNGVTSEDSLNTQKFIERVIELDKQIPFSKMETAVIGIAGEAGEINDLWKKICFHGKPWNDENKDKMIAEIGDMFWYLSHAMECLGVDVEEVLDRNVDKLQSRYPGSKFSVDASENRHTKIHGDPTKVPQHRVIDNAVAEHLNRLGHVPEEFPEHKRLGTTTADSEFVPSSKNPGEGGYVDSIVPTETETSGKKKKSFLAGIFS